MAHGAVQRRARAGFTILELSLVLGAVALVAAFSIPLYFERAEVTLENAALQLARDLRCAQNRAAYLGLTTTVTFDSAGRGYQVVEGTDPPRPSVYGREYPRDGVFEGVVIAAVHLEHGGRSLSFGPRGLALDAGTVTLAFGDQTRVVHIARRTGLVTIGGSTSDWRDDGL